MDRVTGLFPIAGLRCPKLQEQPPFMTWAEIERAIAAGGDPDDLWDRLFLPVSETAELLTHVKGRIGPGVSQFVTVKKFCSWLGLCPNWKKTGGRVNSSRTRRGVNRAAQALRLAAQPLHVDRLQHSAIPA
jgi:hypothetical protein